MPARVGQYLGIGGMVGVLDRDDGSAQLRMLVAQVAREFLFALRGSHQQNFVRAIKRVGYICEEMRVGGGLVAAMRTLSAVHALMLIMRMDHAVRLLGRRELPHGRPLMINPNDCMIVCCHASIISGYGQRAHAKVGICRIY